MSDRRRAGRATGTIVLLLFVIAGAGGFNYHRNYQKQLAEEGPRPYKRYATTDLTALREAYAQELEGVRVQLAHSKRQRERVSRDAGSMSKNVEQFDATARKSAAIRNAAADVAERQNQMEQLDRELALRAELGQGLARHIKLLTAI